ncbi:MAG: hypothetical protein WB780_11500 [Candidatus Acidiferrales bacterium]
MPKRFAISIAVAALALALAFARLALGGSPLRQQGGAGLQSSGKRFDSKLGFSPGISHFPSPAAQQAPPPSDDEIRDRTAKVISNQHHDDDVVEQYERTERHVERTSGSDGRILEDKTYRVVPTGLGTMKLLLKDGNKPSDPAEYIKQLQAWKETLELVLKPDDSRTKTATAKWQKKRHDRAELVDAAHDAFTMKWIGRETFHGRLCDVLQLEPDSNFHPHTLFQEALTRVSVKIWIDHDTNQIARGEARVIHDLSFGGGILGKLYRGGVFSLEQSEVAPGLWLPTRYQYDYTARKLLFTSEQHQYIEVSRYRLVGPPKQALAIVQNELASGKSGIGDP